MKSKCDVTPLTKLCVRTFPYLILISIFIYALTCCRLVVTDGPSMEPTYSTGDLVLCVRTFSIPDKGDVILIQKNGRLLVKRVAAVAGEKISETWYSESFDGYTSESGEEMYWGSNTIPEGYVYVKGDNPANSHDSRYEDFGLVPIENIWGIIVN